MNPQRNFVVSLVSTISHVLVGSAFAAFLPINVSGANSFPGPTATLIELFERAELVVHASVIKTESDRIRQSARLKVLSVIKADSRKKQTEMEVLVNFGSHWPRPFVAKTTTITFLEFDEESKRYVPIDSRTGLDCVNQDLGKFYVKQFSKLPKILEIEDPRKQLLRKVEWYVELTLYPPVRSQGAFGISALWRKALKAKLLTENERHSTANLLTKSQKEAICKTLGRETPNPSASRLIEILKEFPSKHLDSYLIKSLERSMMFDESLPVIGSVIPLKGIEYLPNRIAFEVPKEVLAKYDEFRKRRNFYIVNFHNRNEDEYVAKDRDKLYDELVRQWRILATEFLAIPELANARQAVRKKS